MRKIAGNYESWKEKVFIPVLMIDPFAAHRLLQIVKSSKIAQKCFFKFGGDLNQTMSWGNTPQGSDYWHSIHKTLYNQANKAKVKAVPPNAVYPDDYILYDPSEGIVDTFASESIDIEIEEKDDEDSA